MGAGTKLRSIAVAATATAVLPLLGPLAPAGQDEARALLERGEILSLGRILEGIPAGHRGRLIEAELETHKGRLVYELEILDAQGVVHERFYDARTGEPLEGEED